ncbi:glycosyltransferase family 2 protein [Diaphorobacter sp. NR2-3-3-1]|nr:glycosyltransferase family 2 protein [Diaphorobacter caeni]
MNRSNDTATVPIRIGIVVPCFNEEDVIRETNDRLIMLINQLQSNGLISHESSIIYIDDGSRDATWSIIEALSQSHPTVSGIKLSRNQGHQNALLCGLMTSPGDALISVDADLQDDLNVIPQMIHHFLKGNEIVYGVRKSRETDTYFKRFTAEGYYKLMSIMKVDIIFNHADYRLLSRRAINALSEYREINLFLRGLVRLLGFKSEVVEYDRAERFAGESKYPLRKMLSFAWQGITSFSTAPLRLITFLGITVSIVSIALAAWGFLSTLFTDSTLPGWASTVIPMYFLGGVQLFSLGIIGEYISKIYMENKSRPRFHVDQKIGTSFSKNKKNHE